jgi:hypothetical protein
MRWLLRDRIGVVLAVLLAALVLVEWLLVPHDHPRFAWHYVPGYAALIGLLASAGMVLFSKLVAKRVLQRAERDDDD